MSNCTTCNTSEISCFLSPHAFLVCLSLSTFRFTDITSQQCQGYCRDGAESNVWKLDQFLTSPKKLHAHAFPCIYLQYVFYLHVPTQKQFCSRILIITFNRRTQVLRLGLRSSISTIGSDVKGRVERDTWAAMSMHCQMWAQKNMSNPHPRAVKSS